MNSVFNFFGAPLGACLAYRPTHRHVAGAIISAAGTVLGSGISSIAASNTARHAARKAQANVQDTNATNLQIAHDTNKTNTENTQLTNQTNIELQEKQNQFNLDQWNRTNEYNSPEAQKTRLMAAGYNPNLFGSGAGGTTSPVQQTTLPQQSTPNLVTPQMQNSADAIMQGGLQQSNIFSDFVRNSVDAAKTVAETKGIQLDNEYKGIYNNHALEMIRSEIGLKGAQARQFQAFTSQAYASVSEIQKNIQLIQSKIQNIDADTTGKDIDNFWKSDTYGKQIDYMSSSAGLNNAQAKAVRVLLPLQCGLIASETTLNDFRSEFTQMQTKLTAEEIKQVAQYVELLSAQTDTSVLNNGIVKSYGKQLAAGELDNLEYHNSGLGRTIDGASGILVGIGALLGGAAAVKGKGGKTKIGSRTVTSKPNGRVKSVIDTKNFFDE